ncbi:MAG TPA: hypothetical protein VII86_03080 [Thermoanaerobaculia bacterium]
MKQKALVPVLLVLALVAGGRARAQEPVKAELDAPFALAAGETARLESENFEVTLRSMSDDSGCDDPKDCSSILFKGTLLTRHGEKKEMAQIMAFFAPDKPYAMTWEGYQVQMTAIRRPDPKGPLYATFRVVKAAEEGEKEKEE